MAGTTVGGLKTVETNKKKYGEDFYVKIGAKGGSVKGLKKGFAANPELARKAGAKGGSVTKRERKS
jgi:general stress protein YciG